MMGDTEQVPLFADLVYSEDGEMARLVNIGGVPHYAIPHAGFLRHVEADGVDLQIVALLQERFRAMRDVITEGVIHLLGEENLFTRAAIDHAIDNLDQILSGSGVDTTELRTALWMMKFRAVVDVHGNVVRLDTPGWDEGGDET